MSACVSPPKSTRSAAATVARATIPQEKARRSPRNPNWRGMYSSWARIAASRGKALKLVLTARKRISAVAAWKRRNGIVPSPKTAAATIATTVGPPSSGGPDPEAVGDDRDPDEEDAEQDRHRQHRVGGVLRLGRLEGGHAVGDRLDAGQGDGPAAKARRTRMIPRAWVPNGTSSSAGGGATGRRPEAIRATPRPIISRVIPTNR